MLIIVVGLFMFVFVLAVCGCKPSPRAYLTQEELDDARLRKEEVKEGRIKKQMMRLEKRLRGSRMRKAAISSVQETERLLEERKEEWSEKGKVVYGEAWEESVDGNMPMKDLFSLPPDELREIKIEAYNKALLKKGEEEEIERVERETQRYHETMALNTARMKAGQVQGYYDMGIKNPLADEDFGVDPSTAFLESRRKHKPVEDAPFHDPRFVSRVSTNRSGDGGGADRRFVSFPQPPPPKTFQAPGLEKPLPPSFPPPPTVAMLQAPGLARPAPPPLPSTDMRVQEPGLAKPLSPSSLPLPPNPAVGVPLPDGPNSEDEVLQPVTKRKAVASGTSLGALFSAMNNRGNIVGVEEKSEEDIV